MINRSLLWLIFSALILMSSISCGKGDKTTTQSSNTLSYIIVYPSSLTTNIGMSEKFVASGYDKNNRIFNFIPKWTISGSIGSIDAFGLFTATSEGMGKIIASSAGIKGEAAIIVTGESSSNLSVITIFPNLMTMTVGATRVFVAIGLDKDGRNVSFTPVWTVIGAIGTIDSNGVFTALSPGSGKIIASSGTVQSEALIIVAEEETLSLK